MVRSVFHTESLLLRQVHVDGGGGDVIRMGKGKLESAKLAGKS